MSEATTPVATACPACGEQALPDERFCENCGAALTGEAPAPAAAEPAPRACHLCGGTVSADGYCATCGAPAVRERDHFTEQPAPWLAAVCDRGVRHSRNEDAVALAVADGRGYLVVCDGVSSSTDSDVASLAGARRARDVLVAAPAPTGSAAERVARWSALLVEAGHAAQEVVAASGTAPRGRYAPAGSPPSCTFVSAVADGDVLVAGWIGDSRAYWFPDGGTPEQLTVDDSWASEQIAAGVPRAVAETAPQAHAITRWLGADSPGGDARCASATAAGPGWLLVCSDGLWNYCSPAADLAVLVTKTASAAGGEPATTAAALVAWANAQGGHDNVTVALARIGARDEGALSERPRPGEDQRHA